MDAFDPMATTPEEYVGGTADWRTDLYASRGTLLSHRESIELFKALGVKMTPELKTPVVDMPYEGDYRQQDYARQMIQDYVDAGVNPKMSGPSRSSWRMCCSGSTRLRDLVTRRYSWMSHP